MDIVNLLTLNGCGTGFSDCEDFVTTFNRMAARSASEFSQTDAWIVNFSTGFPYISSKCGSYRVRAVVALDEETKEGWVSAKNDCCANKLSSQQCEDWRLIAEQELWNIMYEVYFGDYKPTTSTCFIVKFPKYREIFAAAFRDRVVQHWICARLNPLFEMRFHSQGNVSFNCRKGFGTLRAAQALQLDMERMSANWTRKDIYVGRFDIMAFFMSIDKHILWALLEPFIKENYKGNDIDILLKLTKIVIYHCPQDNCIRKGDLKYWGTEYLPAHKTLFGVKRHLAMAIGNILSQLCANFYMSYFDDAMIRLCSRFGCEYKRFVDDFTIVGPKEAILYIHKVAERWLRLYLHLTLHKDKFYLQPVHHGTMFVGSMIMPHRTYLSNRTYGGLHDQIFNLRNLCVSIRDRGATWAKLRRLQREVSSINSYIGFTVHHRSFQMRKKLYGPYIADIRSVCVLNSDMGHIKVQTKYDYQHNLLLKEDQDYDLSIWNRPAKNCRVCKKSG